MKLNYFISANVIIVRTGKKKKKGRGREVRWQKRLEQIPKTRPADDP